MSFLDNILGRKRQEQPQSPRLKQAIQQTPSQRDYPGRTNYGVPEDNMIDTPNGYVTTQQYDQMQSPQLRVQQNRGMQPAALQYEDDYTPDLALNQTYTQGNPQLTRLGYQQQDARQSGLQNDSYSALRRLLGIR